MFTKSIIKMDKIKIFVCVERIMSSMVSKCFMIGQIRAIRCFMKNIVKVKSQVRRCRVLEFMNKIESISKWQIMTAEHVEEWERKHVQAKRQRQPWGG